MLEKYLWFVGSEFVQLPLWTLIAATIGVIWFMKNRQNSDIQVNMHVCVTVTNISLIYKFCFINFQLCQLFYLNLILVPYVS